MPFWSLLFGSSTDKKESPIPDATPVEEDWVVVVDEDSEVNPQLFQSSIFIPTLTPPAIESHFLNIQPSAPTSEELEQIQTTIAAPEVENTARTAAESFYRLQAASRRRELVGRERETALNITIPDASRKKLPRSAVKKETEKRYTLSKYSKPPKKTRCQFHMARVSRNKTARACR